MPLGAAQQSLLGITAFRPGQYKPIGSASQMALAQKRIAVQNQVYAAQLLAQHSALSDILMGQRGVSLRDTLAEGYPKNRRGQTRREWLDALDARICMAEASGFPIPPEEMADIEAQAAEWESIYG